MKKIFLIFFIALFLVFPINAKQKIDISSFPEMQYDNELRYYAGLDSTNTQKRQSGVDAETLKIWAQKPEYSWLQRQKKALGGFFEYLLAPVILFFILLITKLLKNISKTIKIKKHVKYAKIEIVNNKKFIILKKTERIKYLHKQKELCLFEITKQLNALKAENNKLKDIPPEVAKYIKTTDTSSLKKSIYFLENKLTAINELIDSETTK